MFWKHTYRDRWGKTVKAFLWTFYPRKPATYLFGEAWSWFWMILLCCLKSGAIILIPFDIFAFSFFNNTPLIKGQLISMLNMPNTSFQMLNHYPLVYKVLKLYGQEPFSWVMSRSSPQFSGHFSFICRSHWSFQHYERALIEIIILCWQAVLFTNCLPGLVCRLCSPYTTTCLVALKHIVYNYVAIPTYFSFMKSRLFLTQQRLYIIV